MDWFLYDRASVMKDLNLLCIQDELNTWNSLKKTLAGNYLFKINNRNNRAMCEIL